MAAPEAVRDRPAGATASPKAGAGARSRGARYAVGAGLLVAGIVLVGVGTVVLDRAPGLPRWILALLGVAVAFRGLDTVAKARFGPRFPTGLWVAAIWIAVVVLAALLAPILPIQSPGYLPLTAKAYIRPDLFSAHPLGTDGFGRDYLDRLIWGARVSLLVGVGCTAIGMAVGLFFGILAGYFRGWLEAVIGLLTDSLLAFPPMVFLLALVAVLHPSLKTLFVAFTILTVPTITRLARVATYSIAGREFVVAARALGATHRRVLLREILPGVVRRLGGYAMVIVATLIVAEASLSFLGLGIKEPSPSWGNMIGDAQTVLQKNPQALLVPATVLFLSVIAFNRLGEAGRARSDTRESVLG